MNILKIISEHKRIKKSQPVPYGMKRVEAVVEEQGRVGTRHLDIEK